MKTRDQIEDVTYSPAVKTKNGHRLIPDDTHKAQGAAWNGALGFFPQRTQQIQGFENGREVAASSSPSMSSGRNAANVS